MPGTLGLDGPSSSSSSSSTSSTTTPPEQPAEVPTEEAPAAPGKNPQVKFKLNHPKDDIVKKEDTTDKPTVVKRKKG